MTGYLVQTAMRQQLEIPPMVGLVRPGEPVTPEYV